MPESFTLSVPRSGGFLEVAADVAGKYMELAGGTPADCGALSSALRRALKDVAQAGADAPDVDCSFAADASGIRITVTCGRHTHTVTQPVGGPPTGA